MILSTLLYLSEVWAGAGHLAAGGLRATSSAEAPAKALASTSAQHCAPRQCPMMPTPNTSAPGPMFSWANTSLGGSTLNVPNTALPVEFLTLRLTVALAYGLVGTIGKLGNLLCCGSWVTMPEEPPACLLIPLSST